jgi:flagellar motor switch/type III secretory pathway protein FliN
MEARAFRLLGEHERGALSEGVAAAVRDWAELWLPRGSEARTTCAPAAGREAQANADWTRYGAREGGEWIGVALGDAEAHSLGAALLGAAPAPSAIAAASARACVLELAARLLDCASQAVRETAECPPEGTWRRGSAALAVEASVAQCRLALVASPAWTLRRLGQRAARTQPLAALHEAVRSAQCELRVVAGDAQLALRELRALQVGDVLALGRSLDGALRVELADRDAPLEARLGSLKGRRAVALDARDPR